MPKDRALFVMVDSDIDDEELQSLISRKDQKMKKLCRKRTLDNRKMASVVSSLASSSASDSDSNTTNSVNSVSSTNSTKRQMKRKLERDTIGLDGVAGKADLVHSASKKSKTETKVCDVGNSDSNPSKSRSLSHLNGTKHVHLPNVWRTVNPSHYIFSSDEDSETESKVRNSDKFSQKVSTTSNGKRTSQLWRKSDGDSFNRTKKKLFSPNAHDAGSEKSSSSCLTACKSCRAYSLPDLSEQDCNEMKCYVALDCEFVGVGASKKSSLGRCSIVDHRGEIIFDRFVKPPEEVTDYRTPWSGLRSRNIRCGIPLVAAQEMISAVIKDKIVIGHAVHNDFRVMGISHPVHLIRDTASCKLLREMANMPSNVCALRKLTAALLGRTIQKKEHCSVTDARACLDLFRLVRTQWEPVLQTKLQKRLERQSGDKDKDNASGSFVTSDTCPELSSYFDDEYWPKDLFN